MTIVDENKTSRLRCIFCFIMLYMASCGLFAETRIAVLVFELKDLTLAPNIPSEIRRTASIKPLLESELNRRGYSIIEIDADAQQMANGGVGYLFDHRDIAAKLGEKYGVDYVVVGKLHKPSFLFAYLMARLVRVGDGGLVGDYISEAKGPSRKVTKKAVESLAVKIDKDLNNLYTPPPSKTIEKK